MGGCYSYRRRTGRVTPTQEIELRPRSNSASTNREEGVNTEEALDKQDRTISTLDGQIEDQQKQSALSKQQGKLQAATQAEERVRQLQTIRRGTERMKEKLYDVHDKEVESELNKARKLSDDVAAMYPEVLLPGYITTS